MCEQVCMGLKYSCVHSLKYFWGCLLQRLVVGGSSDDWYRVQLLLGEIHDTWGATVLNGFVLGWVLQWGSANSFEWVGGFGVESPENLGWMTWSAPKRIEGRLRRFMHR
jgi:hypothetical protein